jgi:hypothetical protein
MNTNKITNKRCKICTSNLRDEIEKLMFSDRGSDFVESWCNDHGLLVSKTSILRHMHNHTEGYNPSKKQHDNKYNDDILEEKEKEKKEINLESYSQYLKRYNVNLDKLNTIKDYETLYDSYQKMISELILQTFYLCKINTEKTINYEGKYPLEKIKTLKILIEINEKINPINITLDINRAIELLSNEGYKISSFNECSQSDNDNNLS